MTGDALGKILSTKYKALKPGKKLSLALCTSQHNVQYKEST